MVRVKPGTNGMVRNPDEGLQQALHDQMRETRPLRQRKDPLDQPSRVWTEEEVIDDVPRKAMVVILRTRGCTWAIRGGCTFCGYVNDSFIRKVTPEDLVAQFEHALEKFDGHEVIKLYTSGSFLDPYEVPPEAQAGIAKLVPEDVIRFQSEAQAHHITNETLTTVRDALPADTEFVLGVGLETTNDETLRHSVNKEFTREDFHNAAAAAQDLGVGLKAYVMLKPPFLTEREAIQDALDTALDVHHLPAVAAVSFNPTTVHKKTLVEDLWRAREYRPPWLWSVVELLKRAHGEVEAPFKCDVVASGQVRGAHNCGSCDEDVGRAIEAYNLTHDISVFDAVSCECEDVWREMLELEGFLWTPGCGTVEDRFTAVGATTGQE